MGSLINRHLKDNKFSDEYLFVESEGTLNRAYALVRQTIWFGDNEMILPIFCVQGIENQQVFKLYSLQYKN